MSLLLLFVVDGDLGEDCGAAGLAGDVGLGEGLEMGVPAPPALISYFEVSSAFW